MRTLAANSLTPIARITFPSASCRSTPSSIAASRNSRANAASRRSFASPTFQSSLRLATAFALLIRLPRPLRAGHVRSLGSFVAAEQQQHEVCAVLAEVDPIPRPEHDPRFPDAAAYALVVTEIPGREAEHSRLNPRARRDVQRVQPLTVRILAVSGQVLPD